MIYPAPWPYVQANNLSCHAAPLANSSYASVRYRLQPNDTLSHMARLCQFTCAVGSAQPPIPVGRVQGMEWPRVLVARFTDLQLCSRPWQHSSTVESLDLLISLGLTVRDLRNAARSIANIQKQYVQ